jgi:putative ABC transport system permease protein
VVGNVKEFGLNAEVPYQFYRAQSQAPYFASVLVRTRLEGNRMAEEIRRILQETEPRMAVVRVQTMEQAREKSISSPRTLTQLFSVFGVLAFIIAIFGIASMLSLWVKQRTRETGIRMALGATPQTILTSVMWQGMVLAVIGTAAGVVGSLAITKMLATLLFQIQSNDAVTYVLAAAFLLIAALLACYAPARRAARLDPQTALHAD